MRTRAHARARALRGTACPQRCLLDTSVTMRRRLAPYLFFFFGMRRRVTTRPAVVPTALCGGARGRNVLGAGRRGTAGPGRRAAVRTQHRRTAAESSGAAQRSPQPPGRVWARVMVVVLIGCTDDAAKWAHPCRSAAGGPATNRPSSAAPDCLWPHAAHRPRHPLARLPCFVVFAQVAQAKFVKQMCDENLGPTWHVIAGRAYAVSVSERRTALWRRGRTARRGGAGSRAACNVARGT